jgi:hypothetical protein
MAGSSFALTCLAAGAAGCLAVLALRRHGASWWLRSGIARPSAEELRAVKAALDLPYQE